MGVTACSRRRLALGAFLVAEAATFAKASQPRRAADVPPCAGLLSASPAVDAEQWLRCGDEARGRGEDAGAALLYGRAAALAPRSAAAFVRYGNVLLLGLGRFADAATALATAVRLDPGDRTVRKVLGDAVAATGDLDLALWHYGLATGLKRPLSPALVPSWRAQPLARSAVAQHGEEIFGPASYIDPEPPLPPLVLSTLRNYLSTEVLGDSYDLGFRSFSLPLAAADGLLDRGDLLERTVAWLRSLLPPASRRVARCAEWWAHRRPPKPVPAGVSEIVLESHPLHWDNDGPEAGQLPPLLTTVLYLTGGAEVPAPTLVMNASWTEIGYDLGEESWVIHAREGRVAFVEGRMLHGVLPSAGPVPAPRRGEAARVSLNVAWWPHSCRQPRQAARAGIWPTTSSGMPVVAPVSSSKVTPMVPEVIRGALCRSAADCRRTRDPLEL